MPRTVKCKVCGKSFQLGQYNYKDGNRYVCNTCAFAHNQEVRARKRAIRNAQHAAKVEQRYQKTGMTQSYLVMAIKLIIGALFIIGSLTTIMTAIYVWDAKTIPKAILGIILGVAFLLWGIIPYRNGQKNLKNKSE